MVSMASMVTVEENEGRVSRALEREWDPLIQLSATKEDEKALFYQRTKAES